MWIMWIMCIIRMNRIFRIRMANPSQEGRSGRFGLECAKFRTVSQWVSESVSEVGIELLGQLKMLPLQYCNVTRIISPFVHALFLLLDLSRYLFQVLPIGIKMLWERLKLNFSKCNLINTKKGANGAIVWMFHNFPSHAFMSTLDLSNVESGNSFGNKIQMRSWFWFCGKAFKYSLFLAGRGVEGSEGGLKKCHICLLFLLCRAHSTHRNGLKIDLVVCRKHVAKDSSNIMTHVGFVYIN